MPAIRERVQNVRVIPCVENAVSGFEAVLKSLEDEVKHYVKYVDVAGSLTPSWGGWGSWRRVKYAFGKNSIVELEGSPLGKISALHMASAPMDLSWISDLENEDRESIATLGNRASSLDAIWVGRAGSTLSLVSQNSVRSWAGIEDVIPTIGDTSPEMNVCSNEADNSVAGNSETNNSETNNSETNNSEADNCEASEEQQDTFDEDDPFKRKVSLWSGERQLSAIATIDTGSNLNLINKSLVTKLEAPVNRLTTPPIRLTPWGSNELTTEGTIMLVLRFEDSTEYTEVRFHALPSDALGSRFGILLGTPWLETTSTYRRARQGI